jgi:Na+/proline symporter
MKKRDIETVIREALEEEDQEFMNALEEPDLTEQVTALFHGRWRFINAMSIVAMLLLLAVAIYCAVRFFSSSEVLQALRWGAGLALAWFGVAFLKLWAWLELERHAVTREIKRLELQVANLGLALGKSRERSES